MDATFRRSPIILSRKLQALRFIKEFFREWGKSPSLGEIGNALGVSRQRVSGLLRQLHADGDIVLKPGPRGIVLPAPAEMVAHVDMMLALIKAGVKVYDKALDAMLPEPHPFLPLTYSGLPLLPELENIPAIATGGNHHDDSDGDRAAI